MKPGLRIGLVADVAADRLGMGRAGPAGGAGRLFGAPGARPPGPVPSAIADRARRIFGVELDDLAKSDSPFVLAGAPQEMAAQLADRQERLGIAYLTAAEELRPVLASVIERLGPVQSKSARFVG